MKPKPLSSLNHLTVPVGITNPNLSLNSKNARRPVSGAIGPVGGRERIRAAAGSGDTGSARPKRPSTERRRTPGRIEPSATCKRGVAGALLEERAHRSLQVLGLE